jgi:biotin carboxylase
MNIHNKPSGRLIILMPESTYRAEPFIEAAKLLGLEVVIASDRCHALADFWRVPLALSFQDPARAVAEIVTYVREHQVDAIIPVDDRTTELAASACQILSLPHNTPEAAQAANNKRIMRELLLKSEVPGPAFKVVDVSDDPAAIARLTTFPCVLKPLLLSGSRGVIRADTVPQFLEAHHRISGIIDKTRAGRPDEPDAARILIEQYIPGCEIALEGILSNGSLHVLAVFDKPDPLEGPFFEETIYVTPSLLPKAVLQDVANITESATQAMGLQVGPVHAELRINEEGVWLIEVAGRSIGGLCSRTLQFGLGMTLEELILRQACNLDLTDIERQDHAAGVMMLPVPGAGILRSVSGQKRASSVAGIEDVVITARHGDTLVPLPEGSSYLGFIFARGDTPQYVDRALRLAYRELKFHVAEQLPVLSN